MLKKQIYDALELTEDSGKIAVVFNILIIILIIASVVSVIIPTFPQIHNEPNAKWLKFELN